MGIEESRPVTPQIPSHNHQLWPEQLYCSRLRKQLLSGQMLDRKFAFDQILSLQHTMQSLNVKSPHNLR